MILSVIKINSYKSNIKFVKMHASKISYISKTKTRFYECVSKMNVYIYQENV